MAIAVTSPTQQLTPSRRQKGRWPPPARVSCVEGRRASASRTFVEEGDAEKATRGRRVAPSPKLPPRRRRREPTSEGARARTGSRRLRGPARRASGGKDTETDRLSEESAEETPRTPDPGPRTPREGGGPDDIWRPARPTCEWARGTLPVVRRRGRDAPGHAGS
ncbi:hypothetical protein THAOC_36487 [Thalassiosira oceanica]|uniref:Uncharacterized protein n=1 Tax=Thalassiosira oceanica TaxID=159749 RepID=K0R827_THAOC|nr:hypothetical protein THAOC_36487 [Thalassiosira oceanica]|eukprot:EJK44936.1 hypothetical protein THAOC_36487 [Thalassiosira oceanica]